MSTTGHYTRYINQYEGWSDNCDTMYKPVISPLPKKDKYDFNKMGYYQVEHNAGNTWSWCEYNSEGSYDIPGSRFWFNLYEFTGKKAIQNVLDHMVDYPVDKIIDQIIKTRFYNRSYADYFRFYLIEVDINV